SRDLSVISGLSRPSCRNSGLAVYVFLTRFLTCDSQNRLTLAECTRARRQLSPTPPLTEVDARLHGRPEQRLRQSFPLRPAIAILVPFASRLCAASGGRCRCRQSFPRYPAFDCGAVIRA